MADDKTRLFDRIIISDTLEGVREDRIEDYLTHALCLSGRMDFEFNGGAFTLAEGELMIVRKAKWIERINCSADFTVKVIYSEASFIEHSTPLSNYGMKGQLALFINPIMKLTAEQFKICYCDFENVSFRHAAIHLPFYEEGIRCAMQLMIIDFFNFHAELYGDKIISQQYAAIMNQFLSLLERGDYRKYRDIGYYASNICVTPKYLSEICKKVSGHSANFWINRFTTLDISRQLRNKHLSLTDISELFNFSSTAYFTRYVQRNLGMRPSDFRE